MSIDPNALSKALELLVVGWGGVYVVLGVIYVASLVLTRLFPTRKGE